MCRYLYSRYHGFTSYEGGFFFWGWKLDSKKILPPIQEAVSYV